MKKKEGANIVRVDAQLLKRMRKLRADKGVAISHMVNNGIAQYLRRYAQFEHDKYLRKQKAGE